MASRLIGLLPETIEHSAVIDSQPVYPDRAAEDQPRVCQRGLGLEGDAVTYFGYTGYRNARFSQIEVQERITAISRELLRQR